MIKINFDSKRAKQNIDSLKLMLMPKQKRKRLLIRVANEVKKGSKSNITKQQSPDGKKWPKRKKGRKKMLLGLKKQIVVSTRSNENQAIVDFKKGSAYSAHSGVVARVHNDGHSRKVNKKSRMHIKKKHPGCSRAEAKALKALGYEIYARRMNPNAPRGKKKVPTVKWMVDNLHEKEVTGAFKILRDAGKMKSKENWTVKTPSRRFLGVSEEKRRKAWERAFQGINYGWEVKAQRIKRG